MITSYQFAWLRFVDPYFYHKMVKAAVIVSAKEGKVLTEFLPLFWDNAYSNRLLCIDESFIKSEASIYPLEIDIFNWKNNVEAFFMQERIDYY